MHTSTIRNWKRTLRDKLRADQVAGAPPLNKLQGGVQWLVHKLRELCPERYFETRTIVRHILW